MACSDSRPVGPSRIPARYISRVIPAAFIDSLHEDQTDAGTKQWKEDAQYREIVRKKAGVLQQTVKRRSLALASARQLYKEIEEFLLSCKNPVGAFSNRRVERFCSEYYDLTLRSTSRVLEDDGKPVWTIEIVRITCEVKRIGIATGIWNTILKTPSGHSVVYVESVITDEMHAFCKSKGATLLPNGGSSYYWRMS